MGQRVNGRIQVITVHGEDPNTARCRGKVPDEEASTVGSDLTGVRVLIVDDNPNALTVLKKTLESLGSELTSADSAAEAFKLIPQAKPHLLISDIDMPEDDGYSLLRRIRTSGKRFRCLPSVAYTGLTSADDKRKAL